MEVNLSVIYDNFLIELNGCKANVHCKEDIYYNAVYKILKDKIGSSPALSGKIKITKEDKALTLESSQKDLALLKQFVEDIENYNPNRNSINQLVDKHPEKAISVLHKWIKDNDV